MDMRFKIPQHYKEKEMELRKLLSTRLDRGKIELNLDVKNLAGDDEFTINQELYTKYFQELTSLNRDLQASDEPLTQAILRLPNVVDNKMESVDEVEWRQVMEVLEETIAKFNDFRFAEGKAMEDDCRSRINNILLLLDEITPFESARKEQVREKLLNHIQDFVSMDNIDKNRFEQEILYYLEKLDITEEKVRLAQHCQYFLQEMKSDKAVKGRKLNFISQEIGREINTLGAKANSSAIQHKVVQMKDELEKIKEQVANAL